MTSISPGVAATFRLGAKGRVVLPVAIRKQAHLDDGTDLVGYVIGSGRIVIETRDSIRERVWGAAPGTAGLDATADVRQARTDDAAISDANAAARSAAPEQPGAGAALLAHLGLE